MKRAMVPVVLVAIVAAACSGGGGSSPDASGTAAPASQAAPESQAAASVPALPSLGASIPALPSFNEGAGDLADVLPTEVGGITLEYSHSSGDEVFSDEDMTPEAEQFLNDVGGDPSRISSAIGFAFDMSTGTGLSIVAFRVEGADEASLRSAYINALESEGDIPVGEEATVAGKTVTLIGFDDATNGYLYVRDDVVFLVSGEPIELANEALAALP